LFSDQRTLAVSATSAGSFGRVLAFGFGPVIWLSG
jgi:hypothetical protein